MQKFSFLLILVAGLLALPAYAVEIAVTDTLVFEIELREGWTLHLEPPEALVREIASHVAHEAAAANASAEQIDMVARKRLAANEAIVYHAASGAHLDIDFSPLDPGQAPPKAKTLRNSARYAADSLAGEDDVSDVVWKVTPRQVKGAGEAFQLAADYKQHDLPMKFLGIIGYVEGYWFFLYYTDPGKDPAAYAEMQAMLEGAVVRVAGR